MADELKIIAAGSGTRHTRAKRVRQTGLAVVHENEVVFPASESQALADQAVLDSQKMTIYSFPVEIEIRGPEGGLEMSGAHETDLADQIYEELTKE